MAATKSLRHFFNSSKSSAFIFQKFIKYTDEQFCCISGFLNRPAFKVFRRRKFFCACMADCLIDHRGIDDTRNKHNKVNFGDFFGLCYNYIKRVIDE